MSKKDFILIAQVIAGFPGIDAATRADLALAFAMRLRGTNGRFDTDRFVRACTDR